MVVIDTDVFVLAFAFHRDVRQATNHQFLQVARHHDPAIAIFSIMELLGQLSFNLSAERLTQWSSWLQDSFGLSVLYPETVNRLAEEFLQTELIDRPLARMTGHPIPYLDSIILDLVEAAEGVGAFVTWNARHYQGCTPLRVVTPAEFVEFPWL